MKAQHVSSSLRTTDLSKEQYTPLTPPLCYFWHMSFSILLVRYRNQDLKKQGASGKSS